MALEQVFDCPRTISGLRSGPLAAFLESFCDWLVKNGFSQSTVRRHLSNVSHFGKYLGGRTAAIGETIAAEDIDGFFQIYPSKCRNRGPLEKHVNNVRCSVNRFVEFLSQKGLFTASAQVLASYQPLLDGYLEWMRQNQDAADGTLNVRGGSITQFLQSLGEEATTEGLARLSCKKVESFFLDYAQTNGPSARRSMQSAMRTFFRFCLQQGYIQQPLGRAVPTLRAYKLSTVPRGLTDSQAKQ